MTSALSSDSISHIHIFSLSHTCTHFFGLFVCFFTELERRQAKGQIDKETILLTIEDPKTNVGSGGATINALLTVVEHISARQGFTVSHDGLGEP